MAIIDKDFLSVNAYAKLIGVSEKAVRKAVAEGKIVKGYDFEKKKIIKRFADKEYGHLHKNPRAKPGVSKAKLAARIDVENSSKKSEKKAVEFGHGEEKKTSPKKIVKSPKNQNENSDPEDHINNKESDYNSEDLLLNLPITPGLSYSEATRRREVIQLALDKKKLEELEDILIRKERVEKALFAFGLQFKKALLTLPARVIADVRCAQNDVEAINIMSQELTSLLETYGNFDKVKLTNK